MVKINIPSWMDELARGAAYAARRIAGGELTNEQHERLKGLVADKMEPAWRELKILRGKKENLIFKIDEELRTKLIPLGPCHDDPCLPQAHAARGLTSTA
jgi:hypothetical protein